MSTMVGKQLAAAVICFAYLSEGVIGLCGYRGPRKLGEVSDLGCCDKPDCHESCATDISAVIVQHKATKNEHMNV